MSKEENVIKYYVLCNKLKQVIRTGWKDWHVDSCRLESVAEHIYGTEMLAIAMKSEYQYDIDLAKVIMMLAVHELEEIKIGDLTQFQITREEKEKIGHQAVNEVLSDLLDGQDIKKLVLEFDERKTKEAKFAYYCDKLECDLQCRIYDEDNLVNLTGQNDNKSFYDKDVQRLLKQNKSWSEMWLAFSRNKYNYDDSFNKVSKYVLNNKITKI